MRFKDLEEGNGQACRGGMDLRTSQNVSESNSYPKNLLRLFLGDNLQRLQ